MRIILGLCLLLAVACQQQPVPATSAPGAAAAKPGAGTSSSALAVAATAPATPAEAGGSCCGGAGGCSGGAGSCCGGGGEVAVVADTPVPADAQWTELQVAGIKCGGCARRIKTAVTAVTGVLGVDVNLATRTVRIATAKGNDGRALAAPAIDALGYRVQ